MVALGEILEKPRWGSLGPHGLTGQNGSVDKGVAAIDRRARGDLNGVIGQQRETRRCHAADKDVDEFRLLACVSLCLPDAYGVERLHWRVIDWQGVRAAQRADVLAMVVAVVVMVVTDDEE